jgi:hypothetical protein
MILTYTYGGINRSFSIIRDSLLSGQRQPVISPDNRGSTVFRKEEKPVTGAMQSHQKNDNSPLSRPF